MGFGEFGDRHCIRVFFPRLFSEERRHVGLSKEEMTVVYEKGIRLAALDVNPTAVGDWPGTYDDEVWRAQNLGKGHALGKRLIAEDDVDDFCYALKAHLNAYDWAMELRFMVQIRGVKLANYHDCDEESAHRAFMAFTKDLLVRRGVWYIDVGLEFFHPGYTFQWATDSHSKILQEALQITEREANQLTRGKYYCRDISSHFMEVSGFRSNTSRFPGRFGVQYLQCYTLDKAATYHLDYVKKCNSKRITTSQALKGDPPVYLQKLYNVYNNASKKLDCSVRIEVRASIESAQLVLLGLDEQVIRDSLFRFKRGIWW